MLEKVWIMIKEGTGNATENAERLKMRLNAQGLEAKTPKAIGQTGPRGCAESAGSCGREESNGPCGCAESAGSCGCAESAGSCGCAESAGPRGHTGSAGQLYLTDCPEAARRFAGGDCCILLYLTEESRKLPMEAYPYAVQDLDGIDADYLEGVYRRWAKKPWEILRTPRLIVREQTEEDLDSLYENLRSSGYDSLYGRAVFRSGRGTGAAAKLHRRSLSAVRLRDLDAGKKKDAGSGGQNCSSE